MPPKSGDNSINPVSRGQGATPISDVEYLDFCKLLKDQVESLEGMATPGSSVSARILGKTAQTIYNQAVRRLVFYMLSVQTLTSTCS